jgi:hypothetical protein
MFEIRRESQDPPAARHSGIGAAVLARLEQPLIVPSFGLALLQTGLAQAQAMASNERCGYWRRAVFGAYRDHGLSLFHEKRLAR